MKAIHLNKADFLKKVADIEHEAQFQFLGDKPALVDFYAPWCGPCKMLSPVLDEVAEQYAGRVDIYKVNVDEEEFLSSAFAIRSVPTLIFIPKKGQPRKASGAMSRAQLEQAIEEQLLR